MVSWCECLYLLLDRRGVTTKASFSFYRDVLSLSLGRWILDFGKAFSGVLRFESGLPEPLRPMEHFPQGHTANTTYSGWKNYITIIHAESIEMETGDLNTAIVAGKLNSLEHCHYSLVLKFLSLHMV
jgi:hypothetical protein